MWHFIDSFEAVPKDCDLVLAVLDHDGLHALEFPCRVGESRWIDKRTGRSIEVRPTHGANGRLIRRSLHGVSPILVLARGTF
jgi:hypothetical protein